MSEKSDRRESERRDFILELVMFTTITPFVVYGMLSLG